MIKIFENSSVLPLNTFHIDAKARVVAEYESVAELRELLAQCRGERLLAVGEGSNLLFTADFDGVILHSRMCRARALGENTDEVFIEAESGLVLDELIAQLVDMGLGGLENLSYIPGTVGASAVQNVGAYGVEAKDVIASVKTLSVETGEERIFTNEECHYGYRDSIFKGALAGQYIVTSVIYRLSKEPEFRLDYGNLRSAIDGTPSLTKVREAVIKIRRQKLPEVSELGSAGSFFKNPVVSQTKAAELLQQYPAMPSYPSSMGDGQENGVKIPAAWLIEQSGMKGACEGGAQVYERQPLVIVNTGSATAQDIVTLAARVCSAVKETFDIDIHPEVNYI